MFLVNGIGTIDCDYRGEIKIILSTCGEIPVSLNAGDRIAQGVISALTRVELIETDHLSTTVRGDGGFGSTSRAI